MTMDKHQPSEDASPIDNSDCPASHVRFLIHRVEHPMMAIPDAIASGFVQQHLYQSTM